MNKSHKISFFAILALIIAFCLTSAFALSGCGSHTYSDEWTYDEEYHWHACTDDGCTKIKGKEEHTFDSGGACTVCGYSQSTSNVYAVTLTNIGGTALSGISITVRDSAGKYVSAGVTGRNGTLRLTDSEGTALASGTYTAYIDETTLPVGYTLKENSVTLTDSNKSVTVIPDSAVIQDTMPSNTVYSVGDVVYDFTIECYNKDSDEPYNVTLSEYLEEYGAVFINFFYAGCDPCRREMPYMEEAYNSTNVALICFDYTGYGDTLDSMKMFIADDDGTHSNSIYYNSLSWDFHYDNTSYYTNYGVNAFPTTVVIDRYGIIAEIETGSNTSTTSWLNLFEYYIKDDYTPAYSSGRSDDSSSSQVESDVTMPSTEEISSAIVTNGSFTFSNYMEGGAVDVYNWAWIIGEETIDGVSSYIQTSNQGIVGGYSIIVIDVSLTKGQTVMFDYFVSTEEDYDLFYVQVDTVLQATYSGLSSSWQTCLAYVAQYSGDYEITLYYQKDSSKNVNDDTVYVSNLRIGSSSDLTSNSTISADILYNAATNYTTAETANGVAVSTYGEGYGYINYVDVYLASDGYYHVGSKSDGAAPEDDPFLLADLYYGTPWYTTMSVWYEVYAFGEEDLDEFNANLASAVKVGTAYEAFEDYSWAQNNNPWGYVPVNEELHDMLVAFVATYGRTTGDLLENQWLELCRYYVHYGADHDSDEYCYSLENIAETYGARLAANLGTVNAATSYSNDTAVTFTVDVEVTLVPRGQYYKFTVDTSGVYRIYSYDYQTDADAAPYAFITSKNGNSLGSSNVDDLAGETGFQRTGYSLSDVSYDFGLYVYLTAGETYYVGATYDSTEELGSFDVGIYYLGDELKYFATLTEGAVYTYYTDSSGNYVYYLPTRLSRTSYAINPDDNCWYTLDENGDFDQLIYIDMTGSTYYNYYSSYTIEQAINSNVMNWNSAELIELKAYLAEAKANTGTIYGSSGLEYSLTGIIPAYAGLVEYINELCNGSDTADSATYASNAWMLTAYYLRIVSAD